jgi:hypothetical protein
MIPKAALALAITTTTIFFCACSAPNDEIENGSGAASAPATVDDCSPVTVPRGDDRKAIMQAIHGVLDKTLSPDGKGPGQPNEYLVTHARSDGTHAFIMGSVRGKNGAKIDFTKTTFATDIKEGVFDGPHFEALVEKTDAGWRVDQIEGDRANLAAGIGSTDVWWDGLWESQRVPKSLFPVELACRDARPDDRSASGPVQNPTFGTPERAAIMSAIHAVRDPDMKGQANKYVASWLQTDGTFAFMMGQVVTPEGKQPNWKATVYAKDIEEGIFDGGHIEALVKKEGGQWRVVENGSAIGSTDVWWFGIWDTTGAPKSLFPFVGEE